MKMLVDRVLHRQCGDIDVDLTLGVDTFRLTALAAQQLGAALLEASEPADPEVLSELIAHV
jgi:hypothetical protein